MKPDDLPALFRAADDEARKSQARYYRATAATLILTVIAATFGAFSLRYSHTDWTAVVATLAFALALIIGIYLLVDRPERRWYDARAAAESIKTLAWRYAVGGSDFPADGTDEDARQELLARLKTITTGLRHVTLATGEGEEITRQMRELRVSDLPIRRDVYRKDRLLDQRKWYFKEARRNERLALSWRITSLAAQFGGLTGGILRATETINFDLLGIAAAAAAASLAWLQTREHATLAEAYAVTARELALVDEQIKVADNEAWPTAVDNAEAAISREHTLWRARRSTLDP